MLGNGIVDGNTLEINFESPVGMQYGVFDPATVTRENGGTAVFEFSDRDNATFSYTPSAFSTSRMGSYDTHCKPASGQDIRHTGR